MKTILLDCDGVIIDLAGTVHRTCQRLLERRLPPPATWEAYAFPEAMKLTRSEWEYVTKTLERKDRIGNLAPWYPQAQSFVEHLGFDNRVVFATSPWRGLDHWVEARLRFLEHFLGRRNYSYAVMSDKHLLEGDWHIDDSWSQLAWRPERGILFLRPWNKREAFQAAHTAADYAGVLGIIETPDHVIAADEPVPQTRKRATKKSNHKATTQAG